VIPGVSFVKNFSWKSSGNLEICLVGFVDTLEGHPACRKVPVVLILVTIEQRIVFKLCVLMLQVHIGLAPSYLRECVTASADVTSRPRLRSTSSQRYERPRTRLKFGERSFSCAGPRAWNGLPSSLQELTDTKTFKRKLKTFLFQQAYK